MQSNVIINENVPSTIAGKAAFFLISATIIWTTLIYGTVHQPILSLFYVVVGVILVLWAVDGYLTGVIRIDRSMFQIPLAAAAVYGFLQVIPYGYHTLIGGVENIRKTISIDPFATKMAAAHILALLIFLFSALVFVDSKKRLSTLVRLVTIFGFVFAFYAILQMVLSPKKIYGIYASEFAAPFGSFVNRHNFAAYMEMTIALPMGLLFSR
ncbi:MAG: hypothetical protein OEQ28_08975, partial [Acidobacteriota bacterium]|nr:hypothetical protein [Acidobacteriota bacterium]